MNAVELSQELLLNIKRGSNPARSIAELSAKPLNELCDELQEINSRKVFWINLYNSYVQVLIRKHNPNLSAGIPRIKFFSRRNISLSQHQLSLNYIEHRLLRHSSIWWSGGYLETPLVNEFEKKLRTPLDYRIHFALNCGAKSCPAIAFYAAEKVEEQLNNAMTSFLEEDVRFNSETHTVDISPIFNWFRGDFGGRKGIIDLLRKESLIPQTGEIKLHFKQYDWTTRPEKFSA